MEYLFGAGIDILSPLRYIFASPEFRCTVTPADPARPRKFKTFEGLKKQLYDLSVIGMAMHSTLLSTGDGEEIAVKFDFRTVR